MANQKWNYRVIKSGQDTDTFFSVQEVYYGEGDNEKDYSHTLDCTPNGNSLDEVKTQLERMLKSLDKPILDEIPVEEAEEDLPEVVYYVSTDGGRTLQTIDIDEVEDEDAGEVSSEDWENQTQKLEPESKDNTETK